MSSSNPFAPPSSSDNFQALPEDIKYSGMGVYCDQGYLVLSRAQHQLPSICLKTGEATEGRFLIDDKFLPSSSTVIVSTAFGAVGYAVWKATFGTKIKLSLPLKPDWVNPKDPSPERSTKGRNIALVGFIILIAGIILSVFSEYLMILVLIGMIVAIAGLIAGGIKSMKKPFSVYKFDKQYIWINGVTKSVAMQFEPLPKS